MTDPDPFAPPSGALPPGAATPSIPGPPPPLPGGATLPPPTGAPRGTLVPPAPLPPPPPRRRWLAPVVIGAILLFLGLAVGAGFLAVRLAEAFPSIPGAGPFPEEPGVPSAPERLLEGDPGSPVAADPLTCEDCFGVDDARELYLPDDAYEAVGLPVGDAAPYEGLAGEDQAEQSRWWSDDGGTPDTCYFTYPKAPLYFAPGDAEYSTSSTDFIVYPEWHSDESQFYVASEAVRVFDDTAAASAYLAELETAIAGCPNYSFPETGYSCVVTATPALDVPPSVASYGWAESSGVFRYYAVDLQRGNLVARLTLTSDGDGPTESEFRELAEEYGRRLADLDPES